MSEEAKTERTIVDELSKLGKQMADAIRTAWESDDRKKLQGEITEGIQKFGQEVNRAVEKINEGEKTKDLRDKAEKVIEDLRESNAVEEARKGILTGLEALNRELGKLLEKLEAKPAAGDPAPATPPEQQDTWNKIDM